MKKFLMLLATVLLVACTEKNTPSNSGSNSGNDSNTSTEYWVKASPSQTVTSNTQWWVEVHQGNMQGLSVSPTSGSNRGTLTLSVPKLSNETFAAQYAHLIIWCQDGKGGRNFVRVDISRKDGSNASGTW